MDYILHEFKNNLPVTCEELSSNDKELKKFNSSMDKVLKGKSADVYGFIDLLSKDMLPYINSLKQKATKKKPFSFERLTFVMLPLFSYFETRVGNQGEPERINKAIN